MPQVGTPSLLNEIGGSTHAIKNPLEAVVWFVIALFMYDVLSIFIFGADALLPLLASDHNALL